MSATLTLTSIVASATATATATAPPAVHAFPPPTEHFMDTFYGAICIVNAITCLIGIWVVSVISINRLSIFPIIIPGSAAIGNGLFGPTLSQLNAGTYKFNAARYSIMNSFWTVQYLGSVLYSFFILNRLLRSRGGVEAAVFSIGFWFLWVAAGVSKVVMLTAQAINYQTPPEKFNPRIVHLGQNFSLAYFSCQAAVELWSAYFLLHTLFFALRSGGRRAGASVSPMSSRTKLLRHAAQSSEVRLATLAIAGVMRACTCWNWYAPPGKTKDMSVMVENIAVVLENMYPIVLIVDLLAARSAGGGLSEQSTPVALVTFDIVEPPSPGQGRVGDVEGRVTATADSMEPELRRYLGAQSAPRKPGGNDRTKSEESKISVNSVGRLDTHYSGDGGSTEGT